MSGQVFTSQSGDQEHVSANKPIWTAVAQRFATNDKLFYVKSAGLFTRCPSGSSSVNLKITFTQMFVFRSAFLNWSIRNDIFQAGGQVSWVRLRELQQQTPLCSPCRLFVDCSLSQGSVALEMLSLLLYFWVSVMGGLGVFLPPGVCMRSVSPVWPHWTGILTNDEPLIQEMGISDHTASPPLIKRLIYDIQDCIDLLICDVRALGFDTQDNWHRMTK